VALDLNEIYPNFKPKFDMIFPKEEEFQKQVKDQIKENKSLMGKLNGNRFHKKDRR
jgi:hypothetical protein